jgi:hypothetical protein
MDSDLKTEGIRIQIREKLNEEHVKLWQPPYCAEDGVTCEEEMQVRFIQLAVIAQGCEMSAHFSILN